MASYSLVTTMEEHAVEFAPSIHDNVTEMNHSEGPQCLNVSTAPIKEAHLAETVIVGIILGLLICFTLIGNGLVVMAVATFQRLRSVTNMFITSLAIADITVALLVMPFSLLFELYGQWHFGWVFCYFWISCDVTCCTASILHLCVISLDRYLAITQPLTYKTQMPKRRAVTMICGVWCCSIAISFVPIFMGWFSDGNDHCIDSTDCGLHNVNKIYAVISSSTSFFVPLVVMVFAYVKIFRIARCQAREIKKLESSLVLNDSSLNSSKDKTKKRTRRLSRDTKAIKTLGILMGLFIICWLPFFIMYVMVPFCPSCAPPPHIVSLITWLGYINSFINPCVYAFLNRDFRMAFGKILSCGKTCHCCPCCGHRRRQNHTHVRRHEWDFDATNNRDLNSSSLCDNMVVENGNRTSMNGSTASMIHHGLKVVDIPIH